MGPVNQMPAGTITFPPPFFEHSDIASLIAFVLLISPLPTAP